MSSGRYASPSTNSCSRNYIIFIANGSPESSENGDALALLSSVGGDTTRLSYPTSVVANSDQANWADEYARFMRNVDRLLAVNARGVIELATAWGPVAVVMVAASGVGNMWLSHLRQPDGDGLGTDTRIWHESGEPRHVTLPPVALAAGDELGSFLLGSTVVMLLPAGAPRLRALADGDVMRFGEALVEGGAP